METKKLFTFIKDDGELIEQVRAFSHAQALALASNKSINSETDYYSENLCSICEGIEDEDGRCGCTNTDSE